jgi:hypothetical protein
LGREIKEDAQFWGIEQLFVLFLRDVKLHHHIEKDLYDGGDRRSWETASGGCNSKDEYRCVIGWHVN